MEIYCYVYITRSVRTINTNTKKTITQNHLGPPDFLLRIRIIMSDNNNNNMMMIGTMMIAGTMMMMITMMIPN